MKIIINGINGRMGKEFLRELEVREEFSLVGGADIEPPKGELPFPFATDLEEIIDSCDAVIDFSLPDGTEKALHSCLKHRKTLLTGTTGLSDSLTEKLRKAGEKITVIRGNNFSLGVNLLFDFADYLTSRLAPLSYDIELTETHHRHKKDAPSGTASTLLEIMRKHLPAGEGESVFGRKGTNLTRNKEIGVHSLRGGSVVGIHEIKFFGNGETLTLKHEALSRSVFVEGALWALNKAGSVKNGFFTVNDLLNL